MNISYVIADNTFAELTAVKFMEEDIMSNNNSQNKQNNQSENKQNNQSQNQQNNQSENKKNNECR